MLQAQGDTLRAMRYQLVQDKLLYAKRLDQEEHVMTSDLSWQQKIDVDRFCPTQPFLEQELQEAWPSMAAR